MILVTGGAGFIGSNLLRALQARGKGPFIVCDWLDTSDQWHYLANVEVAAYVEPNALEDADILYSRGVRTVVHLGAFTSTTERDASLLLCNNFEWSKRLFDTTHWRVIYASSAATYGDGQYGFHDRDDPEHLAKLVPLNPYAWSKHQLDCWVARRQLRTKAAGLKFFNVYGPQEQHKGPMRSMVTQALDALDDTGVIRLFESHTDGLVSGDQTRDFVSVWDVVDVICWFVDHPEMSGLFNVGTGHARTFNDLARAAITANDGRGRVEYGPMPDALRAQYQSHTQADLTRLREAGYTAPFMTLEDGVERLARHRWTHGR